MAPLIPGLGATELIIILVIILVLFGPKRLPQLGKSLGKTMKAVRDGVDGKDDDEEDSGDSAKAEDSGDESEE